MSFRYNGDDVKEADSRRRNVIATPDPNLVLRLRGGSDAKCGAESWSKQSDLAEVILSDVMSASRKDFAKLSVSTLSELCHHLVSKFGKNSPPDLKDNVVISSIKSLEERLADLARQIDGGNKLLSNQISDCNSLLAGQIADSNKLLSDQVLKAKNELSQRMSVNPARPPVLHQTNTTINSSASIAPCEPTSAYHQNVIPDDLKSRLLAFCQTLKYEKEGGHGATPFGETYKYKKPYKNYVTDSAVHVPRPMPEIVMELVASMLEEFPELAGVNQCLINEFIGSESYLVEHEDNEEVICPLSSIFTWSMGDEAEILFNPKGHESEPQVLSPKDGSLYVMSRKSQDLWTHQIVKSEERDPNFRRYSITLRTVGAQFRRSTVIIGDSNTEHLNFGTGPRSFGYNMPGQRIKAAKIADINPLDCTGYNNIVLHTGLNDLKPYKANIPALADELINKVELIRSICPKARVTVDPILPTMLHSINTKAMEFNAILESYINSSPANNKLRQLNCGEFLDESSNLMKEDLLRYRRRDNYHIGSNGYFMLSKLIRERVRGARVNSTSYAGITSNDRQSNNAGPKNYSNNLGSDARSNVRSDVRRDVRSDGRSDVRRDVRSDVRSAVGSGSRSPVNLMRQSQPHAFSNTMPAQSAQT